MQNTTVSSIALSHVLIMTFICSSLSGLVQKAREMFHLYNNIVHYRNGGKTLICYKTLVVRQFSIVPSAPIPTPNPLVVNHLIKQYGFSRDKAISASTRFPRSVSPTTLTSVPDFFKQNGFSDTHIRNIISKEPRLLCSKIDKTLKPKLELLKGIGLSGSSLADLIVHDPTIVWRSVDNHMIPTIKILRSVLISNENIVKVLNRSSCRGGNATVINVGFLRQFGISDKEISTLLLRHPRVMGHKPGWLKCQVDRVKKLGVKRDSAAFVKALGVIGSLSEATLNEKFDLFRSYGWSESDILSAFSRVPAFLAFSEGKIRKMMSFLIDELEYDPKVIVKMPQLLTYNLEKRLKPRCTVMKILNSKGLLTKKFSIQTIAVISEKKFLEEYVVKFVDRAPEVQAYTSFTV